MQLNFSIISYFDEQTTKEIRSLQEDLGWAKEYQGSTALWLPHITAGSGLSVEDYELDEFYDKLSAYPKIVLKNQDRCKPILVYG